MAGESVLLRDQYPDQFRTVSFSVDINQADGTATRHLTFDKRAVIDSIDVVGLKVGATKTLQFYVVPIGSDIYDASTGANVCGDATLNNATWVGPDGTSRTADATHTGWVSLAMITTANKVEAGSVLVVKQTGAAAASKDPQVVVRFRERIQ